jgi:hypothetical protein
MVEKRNACRILVGKPERKSPLGRPRHKWVDNIKMDIREIGWGGIVRTGLIWLRIGNSGGLFEHGNESSRSIKISGNFE